MKYYNTIFDILLFESFFAFMFGVVLTYLDDPLAKTLVPVAAVSFVVALLMGIAGKAFNLFKKMNPSGDF